MKRTAKQGFIHGTIVLMSATMIVKVIGMIFKIPLANILGGSGMGYFMTAYGLFNPLYALAIAGFPVAVSKLVSESAAKKQFKDVKKILKISYLLFFISGLTGFLLMFCGSRFFAQAVNNPDAFLAVAAMSPAIFFGCMMASLRGYYEGLSNMYPTAFSQIAEALAKLTFGILIAVFVIDTCLNQFYTTGAVLGTAVSSLEDAYTIILPIAAAGAILGITISTAFGVLYLFLRHWFKGDGITKAQIAGAPPAKSGKTIVKSLIKIAVPVCMSAILVNITSLIDLMSIMNRLTVALERAPTVVMEMYAGLLPASIEAADIPNFLYGSYAGLAVTIFNLVPSITTAIGVSALPAVASAWALRSDKLMKRNVESVLKIASFIAIPAGLGIFAMSEQILMLLFSSRGAEVMIAAPVLRMMGLGVIFVAIATPVNSMLQAIGRVDLPVKLMLIGAGFKLAINYIFVAVPHINIKGAPYGTIVCYSFIVIVSLVVLIKETKVKINYGNVFMKPLFAGIFCAITAATAYSYLARLSSSRLITLVSIGIGGLFYAILLFLTGAITREDVILVPNGEKVVKILEKCFLLR